MQDHDEALRRLAGTRWRVASVLTVVMLAVYFGFIALTALGKSLMGTRLGTGLSVGIVLGALVIVTAFTLTGLYVRWANVNYDPELHRIRKAVRDDGARGGAA
jgi:uncharacterized membrane protein (DUF485 family)